MSLRPNGDIIWLLCRDVRGSNARCSDRLFSTWWTGVGSLWPAPSRWIISEICGYASHPISTGATGTFPFLSSYRKKNTIFQGTLKEKQNVKKKTQKKHIGQWWNCVGFQDRGSLWAYIAGPVKGPLSLSWQFPNKFVSLCCRFFCFVVVKEEKKKKPPSSPCCPHSVDKVI